MFQNTESRKTGSHVRGTSSSGSSIVVVVTERHFIYNTFYGGGCVFISVRPSVRPFVCLHDYAKIFHAIFIKPYAIIDQPFQVWGLILLKMADRQPF